MCVDCYILGIFKIEGLKKEMVKSDILDIPRPISTRKNKVVVAEG
jgi:hypothetical protein